MIGVKTVHYKKIKVLIYLTLVIGIFVTACNSASQISEISGTDTPELPFESPSPTETSFELEMSLQDQEAMDLMNTLAFGPEPQEAVETILAAEDERFIAVFIELMRANQIGLLSGAGYVTHIEALETLSGQSLGDDWPAWVEWYGSTSLTPPPGFTGWKGKVLGGIDPGFEAFLQDDFPSAIRVEEIQWGGVLVDGIPALDNATMIPANDARYLEPDEPVFGISINGDHRAYPLRIMDWHEMANDVVGGVPVSLAYCTLCGAGIAYDGRASNGETYNFGSSGFLFRSNKLMYDRQTRTLWNQLTGEPVLGELVNKDIRLNFLPVVVTSWQSWLAQHPDTLVLDINTGYQRPYLPGAAYGLYFATDETMFPVWQRSQLLDTKDRIYALRVEEIPKAYPVEILIEEQIVNDTIGKTNVVLISTRGDITVAASDLISYNAGGEVRAFYRLDERFELGTDPDTVQDSSGRTWQITEEALVSPDGELALRINGHLAYWFGWYSFFPQTLLYGE
jgi:hypothetical protein